MNEVVYYMITPSERTFVRDIIQDLMALADPSEYLQEEVNQAFEILDSLNKTTIKENNDE